MEKTPRKSPRLNKYVVIIDSTSIICSRPSFDLHEADCGLYTCSFAEYVCRGDMDISMSVFDSENLRLQYKALLWNYGKRKIDTGAISQNEDSGKGGQLIRKEKKD
ncbi:hypothetical protein RDI58_027109 [Solanum bulbocastanum]|uniref:Uncharacterized protein n=1 Tax=Solanum bulbocastanum TaxID=147425 RepID=A0AAN8T1Q3_SOLBU